MPLPSEVISALIGAGSALLVVALNEALRRKQRIEVYASSIFTKRLEIYEGLWQRIGSGQELADAALKTEMSDEERQSLVSAAVLSIAEYTDEHALYLDEAFTVHCCTLFMGVESARKLSKEERTIWDAEYFHRLRETRRMLKEASGISRVNRVFTAVHKPVLNSPVIRYFREQVKIRV